ncbi:MgtC/SapB family protein [Sphingosinicella soli]
MALALGLLVGLERGWSARGEPAGGRVAGFRTFGLLGLLGGLSGVMLAEARLPAVLLIAAAALALVAGYVRDMARDSGASVSATTTIAGLITLALGLLATTDHVLVASVSAGVMVLLLSMREELHAWIRGLTAAEVKAVARFALISIVVWPLLPDAAYGPYDAWNPRDIWLVVVLVSGLSFVGYVAAKRFGEVRGTLATAAAGALVSSTAATAALARRLAAGEDAPAPAIAGIALAGAVMMTRTLILAAVVAGFVVPMLAWVLVPGGIAALAATAFVMRNNRRAPSRAAPMTSSNPFDILPALGFAALIAVAALFARWAEARYGDAGLGVIIALTGTFDVDAATVTLGALPAGSLDPVMAGIVLGIPVLLNTAFKAAICIALAGWRRGWPAAAALLFSFAAGGIGLVALATTL